ncbi:MAG: tetratricopeptide repeat protein [Archangiaceae bacterium]|nr:tetratricopeptide repeat protein [Archangiaceae bacterium]
MATSTGKDPSQDEEFLSQLYKGGELLAAGKVVEAKDHLERAFNLHPKNEKAQNLLGLTYFKLGLFDRASEIYELLVRENPADPTLRVNLGLVYLKTNNLPRAVKEFETSTDLEPTHKKAHNYLGLALAQTGDYARAREHFVIAGSDAMAEKMGRAIASGAAAPVAVTPAPPPSVPRPPVPAPVEQPPVEAAPPAAAELAEPAPPVEEVLEKHMVPAPPPDPARVPSFDVLVMPETSASDVLEVTSEDDIPDDAEVIPAEALLKPKAPVPSADAQLSEAARSMGGAQKAPLPAAGYEEVPPPSPSSPVTRALRNDWGAQFGMDEPPAPPPAPPNGTADEMRFAEDEGPSAMPMPDEVATSEAAVATGAQVPVEVARTSETWDEGMPVVEATAEEVLVEVDVPASAQRAGDVALADAAERLDGDPHVPPPEELPPGLNFTGTPPTVEVAIEEAAPAAPAELPVPEAAPVEMFPTSTEAEGYAADYDGAAAPEQPAVEQSPEWLTEGQEPQPAYAAENGVLPVPPEEPQPYAVEDQQYAPVADVPQPLDAEEQYAPSSDAQQFGAEEQQYAPVAEAPQQFGAEEQQYAPVADAPEQFGAEEQQYAPAADEGALAAQAAGGEQAGYPSEVPLTGEVPTAAADMAQTEATRGYSPMNAPRLEELGPSATMGFDAGEMTGPFNLSAEGLALSVNGELLTRMPNLLAVVGSVDATPENRRSRGRSTDQPFGSGDQQVQRVRGSGLIHLDPGGFTYQAIDLADEGAYVREERVFAFEEAVAFENARLTGQGNIAVDVVHLKGQGKVLLRLEGSLKAMAIPPGTPLKVPLARLVGWYGYVSVRVMGFVGQGAVELTGDGYVLLAA